MDRLRNALAACTLTAVFAAGASAGEQPGREVFEVPGLRLKIELTPEAVGALREDPRAYVRGTVREGDTVYQDVGVRLKGFLGSFRSVDQKACFSLKFNHFNPSQRFHGLRKILLNNSVQDSSYLCEYLAGELFRAAGVPAPRVGYALVQLNDHRLGLYAVLEPINKDFLKHWFKDSSGHLYQGPGDVNTDRLATVSSGHTSDRADLRALAEAAREPVMASRMERLEKMLDVDRFLSFLALEAITGHWDGYTTGVNNYRLYHDPASGRMVFLPHGTDQLFQNPGALLTPQMTLQANGQLAKSILKVSAGRRRYRERLRELVDRFDAEALKRKIAEQEARIRLLLREEGPGALLGHALAVRSLSYRIGERARSLREQLAGKSAPVPGGRPLDFDESGRARISGWEQRAFGGRPEFQQPEGEGEKGGAALLIRIPRGGESRASFRKKVNLPPGRYLFTARIRTRGVEAATATFGADDALSGANVRISGDQPKQKLLGEQGWTTYEFPFEIESEEDWAGEQPVTQVELVCELMAARGEAWFDAGSLELIRTPQKRV